MSAAFPPEADALALHRRLCGGDSVAPAEFARAFLGPLVTTLSHMFPGTDPHLVEQAAIDAVFDLIRHPDRFDAGRRQLRGFLIMAARGDVLNQLRAEQKHQAGRIPFDDVELAPASGNETAGADGPDRLDDHPALARIRDGLPEPDRRVLDLMCQGERRWEAFAAVLGLADRPQAERRAEVKRVTDRIKRRLKRAAREP